MWGWGGGRRGEAERGGEGKSVAILNDLLTSWPKISFVFLYFASDVVLNRSFS